MEPIGSYYYTILLLLSHKMIKYFSTSQLLVSKPLERPYKEILLPAKKLFEKYWNCMMLIIWDVVVWQVDWWVSYYYASGGIELLGEYYME